MENSFNLVNYIKNAYKPTKDDLERVITTEEQIELCLKHKCRVDIWRWNPLHEYHVAFEHSGRYQKWTHEKKLKMLAKSVNMMKPHEFRSSEEINKIRKNEWELQKKDSILSLDMWAYDRKKEEEMLKNNLGQEDDTILDLICPGEIEFSDEETTDNQISETANEPKRKSAAAVDESFHSNLDVSIQPGPSNIAIESEDINPLIDNLFNINTESMTIDTQSQMSCLSTQVYELSQGPPTNYKYFNNDIHLSSTIN